ncbi:MAG: transporter, SSS domain protein [Turneriella sp.]
MPLHILRPDAAGQDMQFLIPRLIMAKTGVVMQIIFFGALLSAILSTASGALLAPSVVLSENLLRKLVPDNDGKLLRLSRISTVALALVSLAMALRYNKITELVSDSSTYGLVALFNLVAMFFGAKNGTVAILSAIAGTFVWKIWPQENYLLTPQLAGFTAGMPFAGLAFATGIRRLMI